MNNLQTRRQFIQNAGYSALSIALLGCGGGGGNSTNGNGNPPGNSNAPVWNRVPTQNWIVGVPVNIDLADFVTDPDGDELTFLLDKALPDGITLNGSVISGTPLAQADSTTYLATADDGYS